MGFRRVHVSAFEISRVPITNGQYEIYMLDTKAQPPAGWNGPNPPKDKTNHPVEGISFQEAQGYCVWLGTKIGCQIRLPTENEWEKAARGVSDQRAYPWGNEWKDFLCNSRELGLGDTSPVGLFRLAVSPFGCLDITGNVWEWCDSVFKQEMSDGEIPTEAIPEESNARVLRGGAFGYSQSSVRCGTRDGVSTNLRLIGIGFRVVKAA